MRHRLAKAGMRSISNVVDITNYVMLELGHPLHAFDARAIDGDRLIIKLASPGEALITLDGVERKLTGEDLIIYDRAGPTSMAGTMGGARSEVSPTTTDILMEAAMWDPPTIMYMSRRHDLRSEASTRFERGVDPALSEEANRRASALVAELAGGQVLSGSIDEVARPHVDSTLELRLSDVGRVLGAGFDSETIADALGRLGMTVTGDDPLTVVVPSFRVDVTRPIDLVEEVARIHGYGSFEPTLRLGSAGGLTPVQTRERLLYTAIARAGIDQAVTLPFVGEPDLVALGLAEEIPHLVRVRNPLRDEEARLRPTLLPGLLGSLRFNISHGNQDVALFESGTVFRAEPDGFDPRLPKQTQRVAWAITGAFGPSVIGQEPLLADADVSLALVRVVGTILGLDVDLAQGKSPGYHPGRTADVLVAGEVIGTAGELDPVAVRHFEIGARVAIAELDLAALTGVPGLVESVAPSVFPFVDFDLSFVVPDDLPIGRVRDALLAAGGDLMESCEVFDVFRDASLDEGTHAVAFHCRLRAADRTLTNDEMQPVRESMIDAARSLGARLRGA
jgi:phenylalanyl-tRNA synthetase beta chain